MPDESTPAEPTFPKTRADVDELVAEGQARRSSVCVAMTVEAAGAASAFGFNGRETAAYVLGYWQRHYGAAVDAGYGPDDMAGTVSLDAVIRRDHLPAVAATLLSAGAAVTTIASGDGSPSDLITVRLRF